MRIGFLFGWILFLVAFGFAASENILAGGAFASLNEVLVALIPGKWIALKARLASPLFDGLILPLIQVPGSLLLGAPAALLLWFCRPHHAALEEGLEESLTTFDRLAELADEEGAADNEPQWSEGFDATNVTRPESVERYMEDWDPSQKSSNL